MLEDRLTQELRETYEELHRQEEILTRERLKSCYELFRSRFGPEVLANLDGEDLLNLMHAHGTRDSLVYWLEFKDDEEMPAHFGSIAGGSALKFGIYRNRDTGAWMTGSALSQQEITLEEAIEKARVHRNELLAGAKLLDSLAPDGTDEDYRALQDTMKTAAPTVGDTSWGHKYFSMLYPEKLDDYHNAEFQRFHLVKLLQTPPEGDGRYLCAARFLALSRFLGWPVNSLTTVTNHIHGRPHRYWRIGTGDGTKPRNRWQLMRDNGCVGIGWGDLGDLSQTKYDQDSKERIRAVIQGQYPNLTPSQVGKQTQQVFSFVARISERDLVLASDGATVLGVGRVIGKYYYEPTGYFRHRRPVKWLNLDEWKPPQPEGLMTVVHLLGKNVANLVETERRIMGTQPPIVRDHPEGVRLSGVMGRIHSILERKRQAVIYGPPGTGKTYWAMKTACELAAQTDFNMRFEDLDSEQKRSIIADDDVSSPTVRFCCFHPAYGYEDFIEGFRPRCSDGEMRFVLQPGILKRLCSDAVASPKRRFYLVIDEINRGDIPRIFGELMTILEKDKRGQSVTLPLSGSSFQVPDNVHVIGTMNTADRSISLLDTALRRRFGFIELMPDYSTLGSATVSGIPLGRWLKALNRRICDHVGRDARNRQIGHAYLLDGGEPVKELGKLANVLREDIIPLLEEYCYEDYSILEEILGSGLVDGKNQQIRRDVFDDAKQEELAQALLAIDPSLSTSSEALRSEAETPIEGEEVEGEDTEDSS